jgi:hypothetical protein
MRVGLSGPGGAANTDPRPLTHHEIIRLVEPFARLGHQVDLANSDRVSRRLGFQPFVCEMPGLPPVVQTLQLESSGSEFFRLTRRLTLPDGLQASLQAEGSRPADLLEWIEAVPPALQFRENSGIYIAMSYRMASPQPVCPPHLRLMRAQANVVGFLVTLDAGIGPRARIALEPDGSEPIELPADMLAVLGREWGILWRHATGWQTCLRIRCGESERTRVIERSVERAIGHLAEMLSAPPVHFHDTLLRERWAVTFRRAIPIAVSCSLIGGALLMSHVRFLSDQSLIILNGVLPPFLLFGWFVLLDRAPLELPRLPRRPIRASWRS